MEQARVAPPVRVRPQRHSSSTTSHSTTVQHVSSRTSRDASAQPVQPSAAMETEQPATPSETVPSSSEPSDQPFALPAGKCQRCIYNKYLPDHRSAPFAHKCHPSVVIFTTWSKFWGSVGVFALLGFPLLIPNSKWPRWSSKDCYCEACREVSESEGCDESAEHVYPEEIR